MVRPGETADREERQGDRAHGIARSGIDQRAGAAAEDHLHARAEHERPADHRDADRGMRALQLRPVRRQKRKRGHRHDADTDKLRDQARRVTHQDHAPPRSGKA